MDGPPMSIFSMIVSRSAPLIDRIEERVEVDHDEVDRRDVMLFHRRGMLGIVAHAEQPAMDLRVERLHAPIHHLRKSGEVRDVAHLGAELAQLRGGAAGRDDLELVPASPAASASSPALSESEISARRTGTRSVINHPLLAGAAQLPADFAAQCRNFTDNDKLHRPLRLPAAVDPQAFLGR